MKPAVMERIQPMNELQIQEKVEDLAGKSAKIIECEQNTMNQTEEILLVNGIPISLTGDEGARIKEALIHGQVPPSDIVNGMLIRAGIETNAVELETTMNVKTSAKVLEHSVLEINGVLVDEKMREKEDQDEFNTVNVEIWRTEHNSTGGNKNPVVETNKTKVDKKKFKGFGDKGKDKDTSVEDTTKSSNKKHNIFSSSSIIKGSSDKNKGKSKSKESSPTTKATPQQILQQSPPQSQGENNQNNVPKNKFLSLFSKGKSKDKDKNKDSETKSKNKSSAVKNKNILDDKQAKTKNTKGGQGVETMDHGLSLTKKQNINVNYLDPSLSLVHVEIDGIPVRVTYETFV